MNYYEYQSDDFVKLKSMALLESGYDKILLGMLKDPMRMGRFACSREIRNKFKKKAQVGVDVCAVDILRGRDFGVAPYVDFLPLCAGVTIKKWRNLEPFFEPEHLKLMKRIYTNVKDIDLLVGVMLERKRFGVFGTIGAYIVGEQFYRLKFGDRFFYAFRRSNPHPFKKGKPCWH